ncbi:MAG: tyrosine-type recombinase/integrase [Streptosporangiales bacterium]
MDDPCTAVSDGLPDEFDELLEGFTGYLRRERSLAPTTVENYLNQIRPFVIWCAGHGRTTLAGLTVRDVDRFLAWRSESCSAGSLTVAATAMRTLLRWMFLDGRLDRRLAEGIGPVRYPTLAGVPKALSAGDLASLMAVDMSARDRALVLLLARLGLRSKEAAELRLDDVDWRAGTVRITGKGDDHQLMPLPADVGEAVAAYLHGHRRAGSSERHVFVGARAPYRPLDRNGVSCVVTRLGRQAGIDGRVGAHRLRHGAATAVLAGGGTLAEAGQLLRHRSSGATAIYAKVDNHALVQLVRPWPATTVQAR